MYREVKVVIRMCGQILGKYIRMYLHNRCIYSKAIYTQADLLRGITKPMQPHTATNKTTTNKSNAIQNHFLPPKKLYNNMKPSATTIKPSTITHYQPEKLHNDPQPPTIIITPPTITQRKISQLSTTSHYLHQTIPNDPLSPRKISSQPATTNFHHLVIYNFLLPHPEKS